VGILAGILLYYITTIVILMNKIKNIFYKQNSNLIGKAFKLNEFSNITKKLLTSSIAFWIPFVISTFGIQLGTVFVYSSNGASQAGIYFICYSIFTGISVIVSVLSTIAYPTISSLVDGRKRAVWQLIRISLTIILPISIPIIAYSSELLQILGSSYASGSSILSILLLANIPNSINMGVGILVYAYGNNRMVLILGLFTSIPRTLLYFVLVPVFGGNGAALVYLIGSIVGCMTSILIAKKSGLKLFWRQIIVLPIIPLISVFFFKYFEINYILSLLGTISISYVLFLRLGILDSNTLKDILKILPERIRNPLQYMINKINNNKSSL
jgi:O-antigen/teichoic acid export membrane protein